jgi:hypothetical protein
MEKLDHCGLKIHKKLEYKVKNYSKWSNLTLHYPSVYLRISFKQGLHQNSEAGALNNNIIDAFYNYCIISTQTQQDLTKPRQLHPTLLYLPRPCQNLNNS